MDGKVGSIALANATDSVRKGDSWAFVLVGGEGDHVQITQSSDSSNTLIKAHVRHVLYEYLPECWCDEHDAATLFRKMIDDAISDWVNEVQADRATSMDETSRDNGEEGTGHDRAGQERNVRRDSPRLKAGESNEKSSY